MLSLEGSARTRPSVCANGWCVTGDPRSASSAGIRTRGRNRNDGQVLKFALLLRRAGTHRSSRVKERRESDRSHRCSRVSPPWRAMRAGTGETEWAFLKESDLPPSRFSSGSGTKADAKQQSGLPCVYAAGRRERARRARSARARLNRGFGFNGFWGKEF